MDIDTQGVQLLKNTHLNPVYIFIKPPCMKVLEDRLRGRSTETEESLQKRLFMAEKEMEYGTKPTERRSVLSLKSFLLQELSLETLTL